MRWQLWRRRPRPHETAEQLRYEAAVAKAAEQKQQAELLDGWTQRAKRAM